MQKLKEPYFLYLLLIGGLGLSIAALGFYRLPTYDPLLIFFLLLALSATAGAVNASMPVSEEAGITYDVGNTVAIAAVPFFGPAAAAAAITVNMLSMWLAKPANQNTWKKSLEQLIFNLGMASLSIAVAGVVLEWLRLELGPVSLFGYVISWGVASIVYGQANAWILIGVIYLQHGGKIKPLAVWRENLWYMLLDVIVMSVGGGLLAYAAQEYDWLGIVIFFMPIILSGLAFRLYVRRMEEHMSNLEEIIAEHTEELRELNREKDAFLTVLTHDMKTPLTSIGLYGSMIKRRPKILEEKPHMADVILRNQKTLLDIVNNILDLEKLQTSGTMPIERDEFDMAALVESVVQVLLPQAEEKSITMTSYLERKIVLVEADRSQIERILMNLISNAVKYTPEAGQVHVVMEQAGKNVICRVEDTGYGIPQDELPYIFDRYRRVGKHKDKAVGTGLGLAVTQALVRSHEGRIDVHSEEGGGSTFTVTLPIVTYPVDRESKTPVMQSDK